MNRVTSRLAAMLTAMASLVSSMPAPAQRQGWNKRGKRSSGWMRALLHLQMRKVVRHPGQRKVKKMKRANLAMAAFPGAR